MLPTEHRIKYDDHMGDWRVIWEGKLIAKHFKTHEEAFAHLKELRDKRVQPTYGP